MAAKLYLIVAMALLSALVFAEATDIRVGYSPGWVLGMNYTRWAEENPVKVGDKLVFAYNAKVHDVLSVNEQEYKSCKIPTDAKPLVSGKEEIHLTSEGSRWYICTKANHCAFGMKLSIKVTAASAEAPAASIRGW